MKYTVVFEREVDGGFVASVPELPGCVSQGDTKDEAKVSIREAMELYIEDCIAAAIRYLKRILLSMSSSYWIDESPERLVR